MQFFLVSCRQIKRVAEISCSPWWDFNSHLILCWILTTLLNVSTLKRFCSSLGAELNHLPNASPRQHWKWSVCNQPVIYKVIPVNNQNMALTLQMKMRTLLQTKASFPAAMHRSFQSTRCGKSPGTPGSILWRSWLFEVFETYSFSAPWWSSRVNSFDFAGSD